MARIHTTSRWNFDSASRQLDSRDLDQILNTDKDMGAAWAAAVVPFVADAIDDAIVAGDILSPEAAAAEYIAKGDMVFNVKDYGAVGNGVADDTAAIQACIAATQTGSIGVRGGRIHLPPGLYRITDTLVFWRWSGIFQGSGQGLTPGMGTHSGQGSAIMWDGDNLSPMISVQDSQSVKFSDFRLEGKDATPPTYGIEFIQVAGDAQGSNERLVVEDVTIGRWPWSTRGTNVGLVKSGIGFTGNNTNNDQFSLNRVFVSHPIEYGLYVPNSQSIWGSVTDCIFGYCGLAGLKTSASITVTNIQMNANTIDFQVDSTAVVNVTGYQSEGAEQFVNISNLGKFMARGGFLLGNGLVAGSRAFEAPTLIAGAFLHLSDLGGGQYPSPPAVLYARGSGGGGGTPGIVQVDNCWGDLTYYDVAATGADRLKVMLNTHYHRVNVTLVAGETLATAVEVGVSPGPRQHAGSGTPEGVVTAKIGSTFHRTDGGAGTSFYVKESGTGNTGWVAK